MNIALKYIIIVLLIGVVFPAPMVMASQKYADVPPSEVLKEASYYLEMKNRPDSAMMCLSQLLARADAQMVTKKDATDYIKAYNAMGGLYISFYGDYLQSALLFMKALDLAEKYNVSPEKSHIEFNLATLEYQENLLNGESKADSIALSKYAVVLAKALTDKDRSFVEALVSNMAVLNINAGGDKRYDGLWKKVSADKYYPKWLRTLSEASINFNIGNYEESIALFREGASQLQQVSSGSGMMPLQVYDLRKLEADIMHVSGRRAEARRMYESLLSEAEKMENKVPLFELHQTFSRWSLEDGDMEAAESHELKALRAKDDAIRGNRINTVDDAKALFSVEKMRSESALAVARHKSYRTMMWCAMIFSLIVCVLLVFLYKKYRELSRSREIIVEKDKQLLGQDLLSNEDAEKETTYERKIYDAALHVLQNSEEIYDEDFSVARLAELMGERQKSVSAAIGEATGEGFSALLARMRVKEACRRMMDKEKYGSYTTEAIGQSIGYRSRSHFASVFKKHTGLSPAEYQKRLRKS